MKKTIDAKNQKLGRVASQVALLLMGKDNPAYAPNKIAEVEIEIVNASLMDINEAKRKTKVYKKYSGYPGGQKEIVMSRMIETKGYEGIIKNAVKGMLPSNKLRTKRLLNLKVTD